jgi:hypothetical protein
MLVLHSLARVMIKLVFSALTENVRFRTTEKCGLRRRYVVFNRIVSGTVAVTGTEAQLKRERSC